MDIDEYIEHDIITMVHNELRNKGYDIDRNAVHPNTILDVFINDRKSAIIYIDDQFGLCFNRGLLEYDRDYEPKPINMANRDFIDHIAHMIDELEKQNLDMNSIKIYDWRDEDENE